MIQDTIYYLYSKDGTTDWHTPQLETDNWVKIGKYNKITHPETIWSDPVKIIETNDYSEFNKNGVKVEFSYQKYYEWHENINVSDKYGRIGIYTNSTKSEIKWIGPFNINNIFNHNKLINIYVKFSNDALSWHNLMSSDDIYVKLVLQGTDTNNQIYTFESPVLRFNTNTFINGDLSQFEFSVNGIDSWHLFYEKDKDNFIRIKHCPKKDCSKSEWSNPRQIGNNPYGIKNPSISEIRNITEIGLEPFKRKPYDLNKFATQNLRVYSQDLNLVDQPLSIYIRGLITTDNGDGTISVTPGICFVNDSLVILRDNIILDIPSLETGTEYWVVMEYRFKEDWETPVPQFRFIKKQDLDPSIQAYFAEFDEYGQLVEWEEKDRKEIQRKTYGFLKDMFTDTEYIEGSTYPVSSVAVKEMLDETNFIQIYFGVIELNTDTKNYYLYLYVDDTIISEQLSENTTTGIEKAFRRILSINEHFSEFREEIFKFNLIFTHIEDGYSGVLVGNDNPNQMVYFPFGQKSLYSTTLQGTYKNNNINSTLIISDNQGVYNQIEEPPVDAITMFKHYLTNRKVNEDKQKNYRLEYWSSTPSSLEKKVIDINGEIETLTQSQLDSVDGAIIVNNTITGNKIASGTTIENIRLVDSTINNSKLLDNEYVSSYSDFKITKEGNVSSATINSSLIKATTLEQVVLKNYVGERPFNITDDQINWATLNNCRIDGSNEIESPVRFHTFSGEWTLAYRENLDINSETWEDYVSVSATHSQIFIPPNSDTLVTIHLEIPNFKLNPTTDIFMLVELIVDDTNPDVINNGESKTSIWIGEITNPTKTITYVYQNNTDNIQKLALDTGGFYNVGESMTYAVCVSYVVTKNPSPLIQQ